MGTALKAKLDQKADDVSARKRSPRVHWILAPREAFERLQGRPWVDLASEADLHNWRRGDSLQWDLWDLAGQVGSDAALCYCPIGRNEIFLSKRGWS